MENYLDSKIKALENVAKLYIELIKKDYSYNDRLNAIYLQIEILEELRDGKNEIVNNWMECYHEDFAEVQKN